MDYTNPVLKRHELASRFLCRTLRGDRGKHLCVSKIERNALRKKMEMNLCIFNTGLVLFIQNFEVADE